MARTHLEWSAFEHHYHPKTGDWYWAVGIIAVSIAATAMIFGNLPFAFFILLAAAALCLVTAKKPTLLHCKINERGVVMNTILYPFTELESFWVEDRAHVQDIEHEHATPKIILKSKKTFAPFILIPIDAIDAGAVRDTLLYYLPEEEHAEPLSQKLLERLIF